MNLQQKLSYKLESVNNDIYSYVRAYVFYCLYNLTFGVPKVEKSLCVRIDVVLVGWEFEKRCGRFATIKARNFEKIKKIGVRQLYLTP